MTARGLSLVVVSALLTVVANLLLRGGVMRYGNFSLALDRLKDGLFGLIAQPMFVLGLIFYVLAAIVWFRVLAIEDLTTSYPLLVGLTFVLVAIGAVIFFQETFSWQKIIGMIMILGGIVVIARI